MEESDGSRLTRLGNNEDEIPFKPYNSPLFEGFTIPKNKLARLIWMDNIQVRTRGKFEDIGMYLSSGYDYKIVLDEKNVLVLIAIKL